MHQVTQELIYPTTLRLRGPWLLETHQLLALDEILEQFCARETEVSEPGVATLVGFKNVKSLSVFLSKDRELKTSSFKEAMSHIASQNEVAKGFEYVALSVKTRVSVHLLRGQLFEIKVSPQSGPVSYDIFMELKSWAGTVEAPLWRRLLFFEFRFPYRVFLLLLLVFVFLALFKVPFTTADSKGVLKEQGRDLLRSGINQQNQTKALELVLALESDYVLPGTKELQVPIVWCIIAVYILGFLSFPLTFCMAMWAGRRRLRLWNRWMKFNTVTIPSLVLAHWVYPQLLSRLGVVLRH